MLFSMTNLGSSTAHVKITDKLKTPTRILAALGLGHRRMLSDKSVAEPHGLCQHEAVTSLGNIENKKAAT